MVAGRGDQVTPGGGFLPSSGGSDSSLSPPFRCRWMPRRGRGEPPSESLGQRRSESRCEGRRGRPSRLGCYRRLLTVTTHSLSISPRNTQRSLLLRVIGSYTSSWTAAADPCGCLRTTCPLQLPRLRCAQCPHPTPGTKMLPLLRQPRPHPSSLRALPPNSIYATTKMEMVMTVARASSSFDR